MSRVEKMLLGGAAYTLGAAGVANIAATAWRSGRDVSGRDLVVRGEPDSLIVLHSGILEPPEILTTLTSEVDDVVVVPYLRDGYIAPLGDTSPFPASRPQRSVCSLDNHIGHADRLVGKSLPVVHIVRGLGLEFALRAIASSRSLAARSRCIVSIDGIDGPHFSARRHEPNFQHMQLGLELALFSAAVGTAHLRKLPDIPNATLAQSITSFRANVRHAFAARRELSSALRPPYPNVSVPAVAILSTDHPIAGSDPTGPLERRTTGRLRVHRLTDCSEQALISDPRHALRISGIIDAAKT